jgi:hypothetical protein
MRKRWTRVGNGIGTIPRKKKEKVIEKMVENKIGEAGNSMRNIWNIIVQGSGENGTRFEQSTGAYGENISR